MRILLPPTFLAELRRGLVSKTAAAAQKFKALSHGRRSAMKQPVESSDRRLRDRIAPGVRVLFVGINPGIRSAETGHHFAGFSNRFWKLLYDAGLVPERITFVDDDRLPQWGYGITNIVGRATRGIGDLTPQEYRDGARQLVSKIARYKPAVVALVGVTVWRALLEARGARDAKTRPIRLGFQDDGQDVLAGARVYVLPNPSGRNANYTYEEMLEAFKKLKPYAGG
jgi:TDG/mug DNA glycosylase family protein